MADDLVVDPRGRDLATMDAFRDAVMRPCGLPGGSAGTSARWDWAVPPGASPVSDAHEILVVRAGATGFLTRGNAGGEQRARRFTEANHARLELSQ